MGKVRDRLGNERASLVIGFFNESLPLRNARDHKVALLVDIDSDLYVSAKDALSWLFRNGLFRPGTLLRYDDWNVDPSWGEARAHKEISDEYQARWRTFQRNEFELLSAVGWE